MLGLPAYTQPEQPVLSCMFADVLHRHGWSLFPCMRQTGSRWRGVVAVRTPMHTRAEHVCQMTHETEAEAFEDALKFALRMTEVV